MKYLIKSALVLSFIGQSALMAATLDFSASAPGYTTNSITNFTGSQSDSDNVGTSTADGSGNDGTTYIAPDRPTQGQFFTTPTNNASYTISAISVQHAGYSSNSDATWYNMSTGSTFTIRVTSAGSGSSINVLDSETYTITGSEDGLFSNNTVTNSANGTGTWLTFTFDSPIQLSAGTEYGFDIGTSSGTFFETLGIKDSASGGNPYADGTAYTSGSGGVADSSYTTAPGDRVFIVHLSGGTIANPASIEDFETYADSSELNASWSPSANSTLTLNQGYSVSGENSMIISFDNTAEPYYSEATCTFSSIKNLVANDYKALALSLYCPGGSLPESVYVTLQDSGWGVNYSTVTQKSAKAIEQGQWLQLNIDLDRFSENNTSFNPENVTSLTIGIGDKNASSPGTASTIYVDDIRLYKQRCTNNSDLTGDCYSDISDLTIMAEQWLEADPEIDINPDSIINMLDMAIMARQWHTDGIWPKDDVLGGISSVPFTEVTFTDSFWLPRLQINREVTVPYIFDKLEEYGRIENFAIAGGLSNATPQYDFPFDDTDIYKTLEGASYSLMVSPDPELEAYLDELITLIAAAQEDDGYLYTIRTNGMDIWSGDSRWSNLSMSHELYNAGHLFEAAIAHYQATGKTSLLNVAIKFADLLVDTFNDEGLVIPPGHEIVESGLARLSQVTGDDRYLQLARFYIDIRGVASNDYSPWGQYHQDHLPVLQQTEAVGHVVRAVYLYMGMADVAKYINDNAYAQSLMNVLDVIWHSVNDTKAYITGGLGAEEGGESFGIPYHLPNDGYCETCAQIANVMWNQKMFLYYRDSKYIDVLERSLYNSLISGVSLAGDKFFYPNPLESSGGYPRSSWFDCNCCIGNIARTIPSVPGYVYCSGDDEIYVNLFVASTSDIELGDNNVEIIQTGNYPWDGDIAMTVNPEQDEDFTIYVRIPGWAHNQPVPGDLYQYKTQLAEQAAIEVNGQEVEFNLEKGYAALTRTWSAGDTIELSLPMAVREVLSHPSIAADVDHIAIEQGPIVYCVEWPEFLSQQVSHIFIPDNTEFQTVYSSNMINMPSLTNSGNIIQATVKGLYENIEGEIEQVDEPFTAIPYYAWAHRGEGPMTVWLPTSADDATAIAQPTPEMILGYWTLDETFSTIASDISGNSNNGTLENGLTFDSNTTSGPVNNALIFDGSDDYISIPAGFSDFAKGCTINLWAYPTAVQNWARFIDFGNGSSSDNIWFGRNGSSNNLTFECWNSGTVTATEAIELDQWQMFTVTVDSSGNTTLYKNGSAITTGSCSITEVERSNNYIGRSNWSGDDYFEGMMDDIIIYNYPLTAIEVQDLYGSIGE